MEVKDVFGAMPKSLWEFLCENGQGLYVPAYQRHYSWDQPKILRLLEDACHGLSTLIERDDAITFLGTIIAIHDTALVTVAPLVKGDVPSRVMTIIDGQQRLSTFLLINTVLHEEIGRRSIEPKPNAESSDFWLFEESLKVLGRLAKTFEENMTYGDGAFQYYPRLIRAYDDSWSRKKDKALYQSPVAHYLHAYGQYGRRDKKDAKRSFSYALPLEVPDLAKYKFLSAARAFIAKQLKALAKDDQTSLEFPTFDRITKSTILQNMLLKAEFPPAVSARLCLPDENGFKELTRLILLANFVLDRIALTIVTAKNEDYAFDMFESLNTTGEPLTAFETFKPRIVQSETLAEFEKSKSHEYLKTVEGYLEGYAKSEEKQDATSHLIVTFALAEGGQKLSKRLSDQRRFLRDTYDRLKTADERRGFVQHLSHAALFMQKAWPDERAMQPALPSASEAATDDVLLCLDLLRQFKHTITMAPLLRFYSAILRSTAESRPAAVTSCIAAIKAVTAFSVLYRSSRRSTDNIDSHYRNLMVAGLPSVSMPALARRRDSLDSPAPDAVALKRALVSILTSEGKIGGKAEWVKAVSGLPAYENQLQLARFILLAATHDSAVDPDEAGLTVGGVAGVLPLLNFKSWRDLQMQTVEHIAPETRPTTGWHPDLYEDPECIHRLGNLTLLPQCENSSLGNGAWEKKRMLYKVLSAETAAQRQAFRDAAKSQGIDIPDSTIALVAQSPHLPMVKAVAGVSEPWCAAMVEKRSVRIAELAWARIAPWLSLTP
jgi:hypothetical protein